MNKEQEIKEIMLDIPQTFDVLDGEGEVIFLNDF